MKVRSIRNRVLLISRENRMPRLVKRAPLVHSDRSQVRNPKYAKVLGRAYRIKKGAAELLRALFAAHPLESTNQLVNRVRRGGFDLTVEGAKPEMALLRSRFVHQYWIAGGLPPALHGRVALSSVYPILTQLRTGMRGDLPLPLYAAVAAYTAKSVPTLRALLHDAAALAWVKRHPCAAALPAKYTARIAAVRPSVPPPAPPAAPKPQLTHALSETMLDAAFPEQRAFDRDTVLAILSTVVSALAPHINGSGGAHAQQPAQRVEKGSQEKPDQVPADPGGFAVGGGAPGGAAGGSGPAAEGAGAA